MPLGGINDMTDMQRLLQFVKPYGAILFVSLLLLVFAGVFEVQTTALTVALFDKILPSAGLSSSATTQQALAISQEKFAYIDRLLSLLPGRLVVQLSIALLLFTFLKGICLYQSNYSMSYVGQKVVTDLRNQLYRHVLGQSMGFFSLNSTGNLMSRLSGDVEQVQEAVSTTIAELVREIVLLIFLAAWIFYIDWKLAVLSLTIAPVALVLTLTMGKRIRRVSLRSRENIATMNDLVQQSITGMRIVKAFGMERHEEARFNSSAGKLLRSNMKAARILFLNSPLMEFLGVLCFVPLLYYADLRIREGTLTLGMFGGSLYALFRMYDPIRKLSRIHVQFQRAFASASRIVEVFETHVEIQDRPEARSLEEFCNSIVFENVQFQYRDATGEARVLKDINLEVKRKQVVAIVGSSGAGKSTLVGLIPRFYEVSSGSIMLDRYDIRDFTQESLRSKIAVVTQETFLFNDTVRNNIAYGDINASEERIVEAARAALAHDFITRFSMKYETVIGERGQRLSGGERQRISIARAILKNAPILILDEATSALDTESEKLVQQALSNLMQDRTTFVIAHRLSTIRNADIIVVLDRGRIVEKGTHEELLRKQGHYHRFHKIQNEEPLLAIQTGK
jgi:ATP-binding cassette, subfamily B, bacterial MsbA